MRFLPALLLFAQFAAAQATPVAATDAPCARCHQKIFSSYLTTPMASASGPAAERMHPASFTHRPSGVAFTIEDHPPAILWRDTRDPSLRGQWDLSYFLGSGHLGTTWLYSIDRYLFESPIAWYAPSQGYDMKPGMENISRLPGALPMQTGCLRCHMSAVQAADPGTLNRYSGLPFLHAGITCEACHGDAAQHVRSGGKAPVVNPARLDPARRDSVCLGCHLEGDVTVERAGRSILDYRPGGSISDYLAWFVYARNNPTARGVSEVEQFSQSTCRRMSGDKMSCMSCHDPHFTPAPAERVAFYRAKCLACHSAPAFAASHHPENPDCTACHMPHNGAQNILHVAWTDHRILRVPPPESAPEAADSATLTPIFSPAVTQRDLGMAYYQSLMDGNRSAEPSAWSILTAQRGAINDDPAALDAIAILSLERGDRQSAETALRRVLVLDPVNLTALSDLGTLLAQQGRLADAEAMLHRAWDRNRDVVGLATNLARVECRLGEADAVRATLQASLVYNPSVFELRDLMQQAAGCASHAEGARP